MSHLELITFSPATEIRELNFEEIDQVDGGWVSPAILVVGVLALAYYAGRSQGEF